MEDWYIGKHTNALLSWCVNEIEKKENRDKIYNFIFYPIIANITERNKYKILLFTIFIIFSIISSLVSVWINIFYGIRRHESVLIYNV